MPALRQRNPAAFHVATSSAPRSPAVDAALATSFTARATSRALDRAAPSALAQQLDLIEALSAGSVPLPQLRTAAARLDPASYIDLVAERHAAGLCPYPACGEPAGEPYAPVDGDGGGNATGRRVRMRGGGLVARADGGSSAGAYCSRRCRARSEWLADALARRHALRPTEGGGGGGGGSGDAIELLEDVEGRRADVARSTAALLAAAQPPLPLPTAQERTAPADSKAAFKESLLASLSIHERPSPMSVPAPPSPSAPPTDFERLPSAAPLRAAAPRHTSVLAGGGGGGAALVPFSAARLGRTVLSSLPPPPPPAPRAPPRGAGGLPPPRIVTGPRMVDERTGAPVEWAAVAAGADGFDEGMNDEERAWMDEALRLREEIRRAGGEV
ncbi:hypothetical protein JCM3770_002111 [Rhodotorula araucariae]